MAQDIFFILTPPAQLPHLRDYDCRPAHLAYRISPNLRLLRLQGAQHLRGGIMAVGDCPRFPQGDPGLFSAELLRECSYRGFQGIILDLERPSHPLIPVLPRLENLLARQGLTLFLPEEYAHTCSHAKVLLSSAISGGSFQQRLEQAAHTFGPERLVLAVEKNARDFLLPADSPRGCPLTPEQLSAHTAHSFFSPSLCSRYSTYRDKSGNIHFVLYDDANSITEKIHSARRAGLTRFLLPWQEISATPEQYGLSRFTQKKS